MARDLKFRIQKVEGLYYPCSENKGADQLRGDREADLRLCFRICKNPDFSQRGSYIFAQVINEVQEVCRPRSCVHSSAVKFNMQVFLKFLS